MALIQYSCPADDLKGTINGTIFQNNNAGSIARSKCPGKKNVTLKQNQKNQDFIKLCSAWNNLSLENKTLWNDFAVLHTHTNPYQKESTVTGFNWFQTVNGYRLVCDKDITEEPPDYTLPGVAPAYTLAISNEGIYLELETPEANTDRTLLIFLSGPTKRSSLQNTQGLKLLAICDDETFDTLNLTAIYLNYFNIDVMSLPDSSKFQINAFIVPVHNATYLNYNGLKLIAEFEYITPFVPSAVEGLKIYLRADFGVTKDSSDNVSEWLDQSGSGNHFTQYTAEKKPLFVAGALGSRPCIYFTGSNHLYKSFSPSLSKTCSIFILCNNTAGGDDRIYALGHNSVSWYGGFGIEDGKMRLWQTGSVAYTKAKPFGFAVFNTIVENSAGTNRIFENNVEKDTNSYNIISENFIAFTLGLPRPDATFQGLNGNMFAFLYYDNAVSLADATKISNYLLNFIPLV